MTDASETILEVQGLKKRFGDHHVLQGIDLTVTKADVFVLIGPNGCGKSTLLRCLNLLEPYQEGRVLLRGEVASVGRPADRPASRQECRQAQRLRQKVGMVFQQFNLFPHLSVLANVMCGPLHALKKPRAQAQSIAETMLRKVGLWELAQRDPLTLSGGQQQRVAIARTLAMEPDVVLFDEATSALDPMLTAEVFKVIRDLVFSDGMTMLLVTHDMDFARDIADQVIFMDQGRIAAQGEPGYIFDHRPTARLEAFLQPNGSWRTTNN
jgi:ABC-type polar amino acid transport system ATPase subunit